MIVLVYLLCDWLLFFYISQNRILYPFMFQSMITYVTIIPSFLLLTGSISFSEESDFVVATEKDLHICKVFRLLSVNRVEEIFKRKGKSLHRAVFKLVNDTLSLILLFTSAMLVVENILYIQPYCLTYEKRVAEYNEEYGEDSYSDTTKDAMCGASPTYNPFEQLCVAPAHRRHVGRCTDGDAKSDTILPHTNSKPIYVQ